MTGQRAGQKQRLRSGVVLSHDRTKTPPEPQRGFHAAPARGHFSLLTSHVSALVECQAASFPASQSVPCRPQMFQPTDASALVSGPHPLTQRINEDQAVLEFPGKMSVCSNADICIPPCLLVNSRSFVQRRQVWVLHDTHSCCLGQPCSPASL